MAMAAGEHADSVANRGRPRRSRTAAPVPAPAPRVERVERLEREHDAKVDLGCLPRLLGYSLRRAHLASWRQYVTVIGEQKLKPGLFSLLVLVGCNPGIAQIDLGTHLGIDKASVVALLDRLERAGLLERCRSARDRRRQGIFLTAKGASELDTLVMQVRHLEKQMASRFTRAELEQFLGFLQRFYA
jgi:DNA-binding MarR family transcriptional regulator